MAMTPDVLERLISANSSQASQQPSEEEQIKEMIRANTMKKQANPAVSFEALMKQKASAAPDLASAKGADFIKALQAAAPVRAPAPAAPSAPVPSFKEMLAQQSIAPTKPKLESAMGADFLKALPPVAAAPKVEQPQKAVSVDRSKQMKEAIGKVTKQVKAVEGVAQLPDPKKTAKLAAKAIIQSSAQPVTAPSVAAPAAGEAPVAPSGAESLVLPSLGASLISPKLATLSPEKQEKSLSEDIQDLIQGAIPADNKGREEMKSFLAKAAGGTLPASNVFSDANAYLTNLQAVIAQRKAFVEGEVKSDLKIAAEELEASKTKDMSLGEILARTLIAFAPTLIGAGLGGTLGGVAGGQAAVAGLRSLDEQLKERDKQASELAKAKFLSAKEAAKVKLESISDTEKEVLKAAATLPFKQIEQTTALQLAGLNNLVKANQMDPGQVSLLKSELDAKVEIAKLKMQKEVQSMIQAGASQRQIDKLLADYKLDMDKLQKGFDYKLEEMALKQGYTLEQVQAKGVEARKGIAAKGSEQRKGIAAKGAEDRATALVKAAGATEDEDIGGGFFIKKGTKPQVAKTVREKVSGYFGVDAAAKEVISSLRSPGGSGWTGLTDASTRTQQSLVMLKDALRLYTKSGASFTQNEERIIDEIGINPRVFTLDFAKAKVSPESLVKKMNTLVSSLKARTSAQIVPFGGFLKQGPRQEEIKARREELDKKIKELESKLPKQAGK